jgi:FkbH-like protein
VRWGTVYGEWRPIVDSQRSALLNSEAATRTQLIKCVVWDLDNTIWEGTLLEGDEVVLRENVADVIKALDRRGILHSIASKNEFNTAMEKLSCFGLSQYFLYPQITWNSKAASVKAISESLNVGMDAMAFVDDQEVERAEIRYSHPEVLCLDARDISEMLRMPQLTPLRVTEDSANRRCMYLSDIARREAEANFAGPSTEFLASLGMVLTLFRAKEDDLARAEELTVRTHQLNTTGYTYSYDELDELRKSNEYLLLLAKLDDKYGKYGTIGLAVVDRSTNCWRIKLLLVSCRVISRGVGTILISYIAQLARSAGARLFAEFVANDRNRMMHVTYRLAGFKKVGDLGGGGALLEANLPCVQAFPPHMTINLVD